MAAGKNLVPGSAQMLLLRLLAERDMYGYQMIEELAQRSNDTFALKAGTLYPILHALEADGSIESYEQPGGAATDGAITIHSRRAASCGIPHPSMMLIGFCPP